MDIPVFTGTHADLLVIVSTSIFLNYVMPIFRITSTYLLLGIS
jgi:hypothetical protein